MSASNEEVKSNFLQRFFSLLGPGLITGAADDDPSGIVTYSIAGAKMGTTLLWTAFVTWPLMACVQFTCARIGMVSGRGLAGVMRQKFPRWLLIVIAVALFIANTINAGADLSGMSEAAEMLTKIDSNIWVLIFGFGIGFATIKFRYYQIAGALKWLTLFLFSYVITAFVVKQNWLVTLRDTFIPSWPKDHDGWQNLVAVLGTTITPCLFFWQASQEVEEEKSMGRRMLVQRKGATKRELNDRKIDVLAGNFYSNLVMYFVILTAALTLHANGQTEIASARQAAEALRPLAGDVAAILYALGLIGAGLLAIPVLTGSTAYVFAETFAWKEGLDLPFNSARYFYSVLIISTLLGTAMTFAHLNPTKALFWSAVINGVLAPFLLVGILIISSSEMLMKKQPSGWLARAGVAVAGLIMFAAAAMLFF
jgi:NRAMP (natural resistance-associated macrophage protein)-like metal ion transporter